MWYQTQTKVLVPLDKALHGTVLLWAMQNFKTVTTFNNMVCIYNQPKK